MMKVQASQRVNFMRRAAVGALILVASACGGGSSQEASVACKTAFVCEQSDYNLAQVPDADIPDGFDLGAEIEDLRTACVDAGGEVSEACPSEGEIASCAVSTAGVRFTTVYYDPGLTDGDICALEASCVLADGDFSGPSDTVCAP